MRKSTRGAIIQAANGESILGALLPPALPANAALAPADVALDPYIGADSQTFGTEAGNIPDTSAWDYATASPNGALAVPCGEPMISDGFHSMRAWRPS
jgi:hypothetical protein